MKTMFRKTVIGAAIAAACGIAAPAHALTGVLFDVNGAAGPNVLGSDRFFIDTFDWGPGNTVATDTTSPADAGDVFILSQANLTGLRFGGSTIFSYTGAFVGQELSFQMQAASTVSSAGIGLEWTENANGTLTRFFDIFYDSVADSSSISGCGYGTHIGAGCAAVGETLILSGSVTVAAMNWTPATTQPAILPLLDQVTGDGDNQNGVRTLRATGSGLFEVEVTFADPTFFLTTVSALGVDMTHGGSNADPFDLENPSDQVVGRNIADTAANRDRTYGADLVNDLSCTTNANNTAADAPCDLHMQSDTATNILSELVPEPGSVALLGLGLGVLGFIQRRRRIAK